MDDHENYAEWTDLELADGYFACLQIDPDMNDPDTLLLIADVRRRKLSITDLDAIVREAAERRSADLSGKSLEALGWHWIECEIEQMSRSTRLALQIAIERAGSTIEEVVKLAERREAINEN